MLIDTYNPDVLTCIANLSSDEVFTPPKLANEMLDLLPDEIWHDRTIKFLDPFTKTGVFLREITQRLMEGLKTEIPDVQERADHILKNQVYGIAITELTALLSRRTVYCSKKANGEYSICNSFDNEQGNILYEKVEHKWENGRCVFCGANQNIYARAPELETHAYQFIHTHKPEEIFNMKFDVIVGNPPYQLETGGSGRQAKPIYHLFVENAMKLNPKYLLMIIPSRWFAGGMGLNEFREKMLNDNKIIAMKDYTNVKDCFPEISLSGGVCYFLWGRDYKGPCHFTNFHDGKSSSLKRYLDEFPVLVRYNEAVHILHKIKEFGEMSISSIVSSIDPYGFRTFERGSKRPFENSVKLYSSNGWGYVNKNDIKRGIESVDKFKVIISQTISEHAAEPNKDGKFKLLSTVKVLKPNEICTFSYIQIGSFSSEGEAVNLMKYLKTKFARFVILQSISSIHLTKDKFQFLPLLDFKRSYDDKYLYKKYGLKTEEIELVENLIRPME